MVSVRDLGSWTEQNRLIFHDVRQWPHPRSFLFTLVLSLEPRTKMKTSSLNLLLAGSLVTTMRTVIPLLSNVIPTPFLISCLPLRAQGTMSSLILSTRHQIQPGSLSFYSMARAELTNVLA